MNKDAVQAAVVEAQRFLRKVAELSKVESKPHRNWSTPRESGAVRRASLDLTRALADLRRTEAHND